MPKSTLQANYGNLKHVPISLKLDFSYFFIIVAIWISMRGCKNCPPIVQYADHPIAELWILKDENSCPFVLFFPCDATVLSGWIELWWYTLNYSGIIDTVIFGLNMLLFMVEKINNILLDFENFSPMWVGSFHCIMVS